MIPPRLLAAPQPAASAGRRMDMQQKTIDVSIPHRLGRAEAKARLQRRRRLRSQFGGQAANVQETWRDDHADFRFSAMGQAITGRLDVHDDVIKLSVDVPWIFAMIADKIRGRSSRRGGSCWRRSEVRRALRCSPVHTPGQSGRENEPMPPRISVSSPSH